MVDDTAVANGPVVYKNVREITAVQVETSDGWSSATRTMTRSDMGKIHRIGLLTAHGTMILPAASVLPGEEFWVDVTITNTKNLLISSDAAGSEIVGGLVHAGSDGVNTGAVAIMANQGDGHDLLTLQIPEAGTFVHVYSDGQYWRVEGTVASVKASPPTFTTP